MSLENFKTGKITNEIDKNTDIDIKLCEINNEGMAFIKPEIQNKTANNICLNKLLLLDHKVTDDKSETKYSGDGIVLNYENMITLINNYDKQISDLKNEVSKLSNRVKELEDCVVYTEEVIEI